MHALLIALALAGSPVSAMPNDELCITFAAQLITGAEDSEKIPIAQELSQRGEACEPPEMYIKIAEARLRMAIARSEGEAQQALAAEDAKQERNARIRALGRGLLQMQGQQDAERRQNRPTTTHCMPNGIGGVQCTTN